MSDERKSGESLDQIVVAVEKTCADVREMYERYDAEIESLRAQLRRGVPDGALSVPITSVPHDGRPYRVWIQSRVVRWDLAEDRWVSLERRCTGDADDGTYDDLYADMADGWLPEPPAIEPTSNGHHQDCEILEDHRGDCQAWRPFPEGLWESLGPRPKEDA